MRRLPGPLVLLVAAFVLIGGILNDTGPFGPHREVSFELLLDDIAAGRVQRVVQWRDRLEVTMADEVVAVRIPTGVDAWAEMGAAHSISRRGWSTSQLPDNWVFPFTPIFPALLLAAAAVIVGMAILRRGHRPPDVRTSS
jgi:hypothetical protein